MYINDEGKRAKLIEQTCDGNVIYSLDGSKDTVTVSAHEFFATFHEVPASETKDAKDGA